MNFSVDLAEPRASVRATGYLSQQAAENLSVLLRDLGRMDLREINVDISRCSPVCVRGLEKLLETKFELETGGIRLVFGRSTPTLTKVFLLMGLQPDGEPLNAAEAG